MSKANKIDRFNFIVINRVHIYVSIFRVVLPLRGIETVVQWAGQSMVLHRALYGQMVYWKERRLSVVRSMADPFSQNLYNVLHVVDYESCERTDCFWEVAFRKSVFDRLYFFVVLLRFLAVTRLLLNPLEVVVVEAVGVASS